MADQNPFPAYLAESLRQQGGAEIVVGLPSYNHAATIAGVVQAVRRGLREAFADKRAIIVNTDGGSTDGTAAQVAELPADDGARLVQLALPAHDLEMPYHGIPGKSEGLRLTLRIAAMVGARAALMLSPDGSFDPSWLRAFAAPVLEQGFDLVLPVYARHPLDGALTSGLVRPLVCSLYGHHIDQPMGGEYAMSSKLAERCLMQSIWGSDLARVGSDIWTTTLALCTACKIAQVHLGPKPASAATSSPDLTTTLAQVLGALFEDMTRNAPVWQRVRGWQPVPASGVPVAAADLPAPSFDPRKLIESFRLGLRNLQDLWALVLPPATLLDLKRAAAAPPETFTLPDELWSRAVFDFALGYRMRTLSRTHLMGAFLPLYLGWLASFVRDMQAVAPADSERRAQRLCKAYGTQKPYLISRWRSPDRFNP